MVHVVQMVHVAHMAQGLPAAAEHRREESEMSH
jgi:hypothetical protein